MTMSMMEQETIIKVKTKKQKLDTSAASPSAS
jgi:hypothetical protein